MRDFNHTRKHPSSLLAAVAVLCVAALAAALVSQHRFGMEPCPWCVLQRLIFVAIALACGIGLIWRRRSGQQLAGSLMLLLALGGVASALWQHFYAAASASCNLTLADKIVGATKLDILLPDVFSARASCADATVNLAGMPYEFWSLVLFLAIAAIGARLMRRTNGF